MVVSTRPSKPLMKSYMKSESILLIERTRARNSMSDVIVGSGRRDDGSCFLTRRMVLYFLFFDILKQPQDHFRYPLLEMGFRPMPQMQMSLLPQDIPCLRLRFHDSLVPRMIASHRRAYRKLLPRARTIRGLGTPAGNGCIR